MATQHHRAAPPLSLYGYPHYSFLTSIAITMDRSFADAGRISDLCHNNSQSRIRGRRSVLVSCVTTSCASAM